ncbi:hypothetical protein I3760_05G015700 [Carya illinoinensis]|uniref:Uncharacterized protein n=2 Tax=Carya illinoinensis TaxID=32201 RepID=A0A8T1QDW2_CARIL|nr:hypothetical protein I3760_05G015700 [Carya illinoinensis]KAG6652571.1 hypothetical protein CIPAW_05G015400 [Carya illinoinensis]
MDLGCLDLGCVSVSDKQGTGAAVSISDSRDDNVSENTTARTKIGKNKLLKETGQPTSNALNKFTSQIKKPPHRKSSPINWFPRKKVDSYLKRKIKMLQEVDGMNLTLDETLGDSNPHYSRVLREKMATREAAHKAMEARKAALVEASWCRILHAARIQSKEAETQLLKAEKSAAEAFEAAAAIGVTMYDIPNCPRKPCQIETSSVNGGGSTTYKVSASFETAFEVDKGVAAAVKTALIRLANCATFNKDEFKELLRKISQNPDTGENNQELSEFSSECESESGSELENASQNDGFSAQDIDCKLPVPEMRQRKNRRRLSLERLNSTKLVEMMLERLRCLQEDELSSLATIVATCGLNAALAEVQTSKLHDPDSADYSSTEAPNFAQRISSVEAGNLESFMDEHRRRKKVDSELPSLDKFLIKRMSKLEKEVWEAKKCRRNESKEGGIKNNSCTIEKELEEANNKSGRDFETNSKKLNSDRTSSEAVPDLGTILVKRCSKLEKDIEDSKRNNEIAFEMKGKRLRGGLNVVGGQTSRDVSEVPSLDKFLVKHVSRLEKEVQEAKNRRETEPRRGRLTMRKIKVDSSASDEQSENIIFSEGVEEKENADLNKEVFKIYEMEQKKCNVGAGESSLQIGQVNLRATESFHQRKQAGNNVTDCESLDKILVKHVSRLEKEKMSISSKEEVVEVKSSETRSRLHMNYEGGLDQVLVKHKSRLEREKVVAAQQPDHWIRPSVARREARERELQEAWGGISLGNSMKPHLSKLEQDKAAWIKAEEDERRKAMKGGM